MKEIYIIRHGETDFNKQGIVLNDFEMAIAESGASANNLNYNSLEGILDFGPSEGRINTLNVRIDTWVLPFLAVSGIFGKVWG